MAVSASLERNNLLRSVAAQGRLRAIDVVAEFGREPGRIPFGPFRGGHGTDAGHFTFHTVAPTGSDCHF